MTIMPTYLFREHTVSYASLIFLPKLSVIGFAAFDLVRKLCCLCYHFRGVDSLGDVKHVHSKLQTLTGPREANPNRLMGSNARHCVVATELSRQQCASHSLFHSFHAALFLDRSMPAVGRRRRQRQWTISSHWISLSILYRSSFLP